MRRLSLVVLTLILGCSGEPASDGSAEDPDDGEGSESSGETAAEDDDDDEDDGESGNSGATGTEACRESVEPGDAPVGEPCTADADCESLVCSHRTTIDEVTDATCLEAPEDCAVRIRGTVRDLVSRLALPNIDLAVLAATEAANDPTTAVPLVTAISDSRGWFDVETESRVMASYAVLGRAEAAGFERTLTGLGQPDANGDYPPILANREWWTVTLGDVAKWNEFLAGETEAQPYLPLEANAAVLGIIRTAETPSIPVREASLTSQQGDASAARVFYLMDNGNAFSRDSTSGNGVFLVLGAAAGETFDVVAPGRVAGTSRIAGFPKAIFITDVWLEAQ